LHELIDSGALLMIVFVKNPDRGLPADKNKEHIKIPL